MILLNFLSFFTENETFYSQDLKHLAHLCKVFIQIQILQMCKVFFQIQILIMCFVTKYLFFFYKITSNLT